ncbi:glycoside hydrolase [Butyrivibrio sp. WCD3002]|uniref:glycoside hydrolase n=1 Tax=Butyrivibrio sp. WCD3002 TaxID=1280676 RepID=UPI0004065C85|nr:glycoside hydrolase [Butyrivibrio sp. WCD3002]
MKKTISCLLAAVIFSVALGCCGTRTDNIDDAQNSGEAISDTVNSDNANVVSDGESAKEGEGETSMNKEPDRNIKVSLEEHSIFNDTNEDGYGEFQGFGTSLCWWANRVGYSEKLTEAAAKAFFNKDEGLGMCIGRYNVGGGDNTAEDGKVFNADNVDIDVPHKTHIKRSDSAVPGYAVDVTKIDTAEHDISYYEENFDRAFEDCGYAWNYNWDADLNQMNVLKAALREAGDEFIAEAFSNSPPYFMTVSGCTSGGFNPSEDNLREDSIEAFGAYMADVIEHWKNEGVVTFQSVSPMNEPTTSYWECYSQKQEGCHISSGDMQSEVLVALKDELDEKGIDIIISGTDETSIDSAIQAYNSLSDDAKSVVSRIDTHSYTGSERKQLRKLAESEGKNLWMSEVDGDFVAGKNAGEMASGLGLSKWLKTDMNELLPAAWILWDAVDVHIDETNPYDWHTRDHCLADLDLEGGNSLWGIAIGDHNEEELILTKKYYALGQYTRYIRPGYCVLAGDNFTVCAYDPKGKKLVIVATSNANKDERWEFDLSGFKSIGENITAIRTSGTLADGENWADVTGDVAISVNAENMSFSADIKSQSITTFIVDGVD